MFLVDRLVGSINGLMNTLGYMKYRLADDELIQGIPCSKFRFISAIFVSFHGKSGQTSFHENGKLQYCELSENLIIEGKPYNKTDAVRFDHAGDLLNEY